MLEESQLYQETRDLHHACEQHVVGAGMSDGSIPEEYWVDWLFALYYIHLAIDHEVHPLMRRTNELEKDVKECSVIPIVNDKAMDFHFELETDSQLRLAAQYVVTGAHLMGGAITKKRIGDRLPTHHLQFEDRSSLVKIWKPLRDRTDLTQPARHVFQMLLEIMDEIVENRNDLER